MLCIALSQNPPNATCASWLDWFGICDVPSLLHFSLEYYHGVTLCYYRFVCWSSAVDDLFRCHTLAMLPVQEA